MEQQAAGNVWTEKTAFATHGRGWQTLAETERYEAMGFSSW
jgi:hypothetical protein